MIKPLLGSIWLGVTLFMLAAPADSILRVSDPSLGDPTATISGRVTNSKGKRLGGARIEATSLGSHSKVGATTNKDGSYRIEDLPPGPYSVTARMPGFRTIVNPGFKVETQGNIALNFCMDCGSVPGSSAGGAGANGAGGAGGASSNQTGTATQSAGDSPVTLAASSSMAANSNEAAASKSGHSLATAPGGMRSSLNEDLQLQHGANGGTQQAPVSVKASEYSGLGSNLLVDSFNLSPSLNVDGRFLNLSARNSDSHGALGQLNLSTPSAKGGGFASGYGLFSGSFAANARSVPSAPAELSASWRVADSEYRLEGTRATGKITGKAEGKNTGELLESTPNDPVAAVLDVEGNGAAESTVSAVREPSSLLLLGSGLIGLAIVARRHNSRRQGSSPVVEVEPNTP